MKIHKELLIRISAMLWSFLFLAVFFQNCGQPGEIALQTIQKEEPGAGDLANPPASGGPNAVTLISNPSLVINNGETFTKSTDVMLHSGTIGAEEMVISNSGDCSSVKGWIPFSQQSAWILSAENKEVSVYAKFRKIGAPESACIKASIIHDNIPPVVVIEVPAPSYTTAASAQIDFNVNDLNGSGVSKVYCKRSNGPETECSSSLAFYSLAENSYSASIRAVDRAGNESVPVIESFIVDRMAPVVTINGPTGIVANGNPKYTISVVEANGLKNLGCRLSPLESAYKECSSLAVEYQNVPSGIYKFEVAAIDMAGNTGNANLSYENDLSVPSVNITKSPLALGNLKDISFEFTGVSGDKAITKFMCSLNGAAAVSCSSPFNYKSLADKEHLFSVYGINAANVASSAQGYKFIVDTAPPALAIISSPSDRIKSRSVTIVLSASDLNGINNIKCSLNGVVSDCSTKSITYNDLPDQNVKYMFLASATDGAGNVTTTAPIYWVIDNLPDSKILASMQQNPIAQDVKGTLNISLTQVYSPSYKCIKVSDNSVIVADNIKDAVSTVDFVVAEDIRCDIIGLDKFDQPMKVSVLAEVFCGNKIKENGKCVDFKCLSVTKLDYTKTLSIPARTSNGVCYAMKIFNKIENGASSLTATVDKEVVSRDHDKGSGTRNPYSMDKDLLNFNLAGPRVVKLAGGLNSTSPILIDNFALIGLYPKAVSPLPAHFSAHGTADSVLDSNTMDIKYKNSSVVLKPFGSAGTATVMPLDIVRSADVNLDYILDIRALDCGGSRELSDVWVLFQ